MKIKSLDLPENKTHEISPIGYINREEGEVYALLKDHRPIRPTDIHDRPEYLEKYDGKLICSANNCQRDVEWVVGYKKSNGTYVYPYFRHKNKKCGSKETPIHLYVKDEFANRLRECIDRGKKEFLIKIRTESDKCICVVNLLEGVNKVKCESAFNGRIPDILLLKDNKPIRSLEIWVSNSLDEERQEFYNNQLECFEFYIEKRGTHNHNILNDEEKDFYIGQIYNPIIPNGTIP